MCSTIEGLDNLIQELNKSKLDAKSESHLCETLHNLLEVVSKKQKAISKIETNLGLDANNIISGRRRRKAINYSEMDDDMF